jgi:hypothetical protein
MIMKRFKFIKDNNSKLLKVNYSKFSKDNNYLILFLDGVFTRIGDSIGSDVIDLIKEVLKTVFSQ